MNKLNKFSFSIAYDGTAYSGWQRQANALSIQEILENRLSIFLKQKISILGSGRTDAGVHACEQWAHFLYPGDIDAPLLLKALNGMLPRDIRLLSFQPCASDFHSRFSAKGKIYQYFIHRDPVLYPFLRLYRWHLCFPIDLPLLHRGQKLLSGTLDFSSFANSPGAANRPANCIRKLSSIEYQEEEGGFSLIFSGEGFLYKMVRNLTGALIALGRGRISFTELKHILDSKDRRLAPQAAPPQGLFLRKVLF